MCILQASSSLVIQIGNVPWLLSHPYVQLPYRIHNTSRVSTIGLQDILKPGWSDHASDINYSWSKKKRLHLAKCVYGKQQRTGLGAWVLQLSRFNYFCLKISCATQYFNLVYQGWATLAVRRIVINYESSVLLIKSFILLFLFQLFSTVFHTTSSWS